MNLMATKNNNDDASDTTVYVKLDDFVFRDVHTMYHKYDDVKTRYAGQDFKPNEKVSMLDATVRVDSSHRTSSITFDLSEKTGVALVQMSGVPVETFSNYAIRLCRNPCV